MYLRSLPPWLHAHVTLISRNQPTDSLLWEISPKVLNDPAKVLQVVFMGRSVEFSKHLMYQKIVHSNRLPTTTPATFGEGFWAITSNQQWVLSYKNQVNLDYMFSRAMIFSGYRVNKDMFCYTNIPEFRCCYTVEFQNNLFLHLKYCESATIMVDSSRPKILHQLSTGTHFINMF